jgi:sec-independent protein translocase protein TatA
MGFGGISIPQLLIILAIIVLLFGTKRLRSIGSDLGSAIKGFRNSVKDQDAEAEAEVVPVQPAQVTQAAPAAATTQAQLNPQTKDPVAPVTTEAAKTPEQR